jgi:hypothetical protein
LEGGEGEEGHGQMDKRGDEIEKDGGVKREEGWVMCRNRVLPDW